MTNTATNIGPIPASLMAALDNMIDHGAAAEVGCTVEQARTARLAADAKTRDGRI